MPFNADRFTSAKLTAREATVPVPALAAWFDDGEPAEWKVRGLTGNQLHRALEAGNRQGSIEAVVKALAASGDQAQAVRKALGLSADTPGEMAKRLEMLVMGSVSPVVDLPTCVKLAETFPVEFLNLTHKITELTGNGFTLGEPQAASPPIPA